MHESHCVEGCRSPQQPTYPGQSPTPAEKSESPVTPCHPRPTFSAQRIKTWSPTERSKRQSGGGKTEGGSSTFQPNGHPGHGPACSGQLPNMRSRVKHHVSLSTQASDAKPTCSLLSQLLLPRMNEGLDKRDSARSWSAKTTTIKAEPHATLWCPSKQLLCCKFQK